MPALVANFEYDIFISYRHNDNLDGWVSDFVQNLEKELRGTIKEPLSIYFDKNPHDGLLETHHVDKSLEGKLKCLIFIPIISQTYCDPKSFAWQHEFCAFNQIAKGEGAGGSPPFGGQGIVGRDIKLSNGNVASRILPIKIHDLDLEDKAIIEKEIGGALRAIEFIYKEPGVNRPLKSTDSKADNQNKTDYKNQVNKTANGIKEIINSLKNPSYQQTRTTNSQPLASPQAKSKKPIIATLSIIALLAVIGYLFYPKLFSSTQTENTREQSIAVLSFVDMSPNKDQEYLGDGIAEEILNSLATIKGLKVIGRTSSFSFKGKDTSLKTIGETLGATTILEGSIQKSKNKIRVTAQLVNAADETHIWSERYDSEEEDIFSIQDDIFSRIVQKLKGSLELEEGKIKVPTTNLKAYEMLLRARHFQSKGIAGQQQALLLFQQAIDLEPRFAQAYAEMALAYWYSGVFGLIGQKEAMIKAKEAAYKAISLDDQSYHAYNILGYVSLTGEWDTKFYQENYQKAVSLGLPLPDPWHGYYEQWFLEILDKPVSEAKLLIEKDPLSVDALVHLSRVSLSARKYEEVIETGIRALKLSPDQGSIFRHTGEAYLFTNRPEMALPYFEKLMKNNPYYAPQDFIAVQMKLGNKELAVKTFHNVKDSITLGKKAVCYIYLGKMDSALLSIEEGIRQKDVHLVGMKIEQHFDALQSDPRYQKILKNLNSTY